MRHTTKLTIGIDEAGRGPLAGPVTVAAFAAENKMQSWLLKNIFKGNLRDSKKLSEKKREEIYQKFQKLKKENKIFFAVSHISNKTIDKNGITKATATGIKNCLDTLFRIRSRASNIEFIQKNCLIKLDGLLKAPPEFKNQQTLIKGDESNVCIAGASIVAKVSRDHLMMRLAQKYPDYAFEVHKGYGTRVHIQQIKKLGLSILHRQYFCRGLPFLKG